MSKPIVWSPRARQDYLKLLDYLEEEWGSKTINKFNNRLQSILELISIIRQKGASKKMCDR